MAEKYQHIKQIFIFIRVLYENYANNINNYAINEFLVFSLSLLGYLNLMFENDSQQIHQVASKSVTTNIINIIEETELPKQNLMFRYDFSFNKNKYNMFEYNYLYSRRICGFGEVEFNYKQNDEIVHNYYGKIIT